jgi:hypothetical protein
MEVERAGVVDTSRLYKILLTERKWEDLEQLEIKDSAFRNLRRTFSKKFSFNKLNSNNGETLSPKANSFSSKVFHKVTNSIQNGLKKRRLKTASVNCLEEESEDDFPSARDSAYFSLADSCKSESESLAVSETADNTLDFSTTLSRTPSLSPSPIPILTRHSVTRTATKKSVTILLPHTGTTETPFGVHLTIESVEHFHTAEEYPCVYRDVSGK